MNPDLLQPTLSAQTTSRPIYSTTALFVPSFLGGPAAAAVMFAANAWRGGRIKSDLAFILVGIIATFALPFVLESLYPDEAGKWMRAGNRALGIALFGLFYYRHRALYRSQELFGIAPPSGWLSGSLAIAVGVAMSFAANEICKSL